MGGRLYLFVEIALLAMFRAACHASDDAGFAGQRHVRLRVRPCAAATLSVCRARRPRPSLIEGTRLAERGG